MRKLILLAATVLIVTLKRWSSHPAFILLPIELYPPAIGVILHVYPEASPIPEPE